MARQVTHRMLRAIIGSVLFVFAIANVLALFSMRWDYDTGYELGFPWTFYRSLDGWAPSMLNVAAVTGDLAVAFGTAFGLAILVRRMARGHE